MQCGQYGEKIRIKAGILVLLEMVRSMFEALMKTLYAMMKKDKNTIISIKYDIQKVKKLFTIDQNKIL